GDLTAWVAGSMGVVALIVLAQATYYPFIGDDEISRYGWFARLIVQNTGLTPEARGYPMLMPLAYAATFLTSGALPEQVARLFPALYAAATVAATYALARRWFGNQAAWMAAVLLAATPLFIRWAPNGYLDIPSALYFVLAALAADVWRAERATRWALLTGVLAGLALWTKQAGFAALPVIGLVMLTTALADLRRGLPTRALQAIRHGMLLLAITLVSGGWWYARNALYDGLGAAVPGPGAYYTQQALHDVAYAIPFIGYFTDFGYLTAVAYIAGLLGAVVRIGSRKTDSGKLIWCSLWSVPYTLYWWWQFSYDPRFILTVLPFYAILAGATGKALWRWSPIQDRQRKPLLPNLQSSVLIAVTLLVVTLGLYQARLGGALAWLRAPTASYAERLTRAKGDMYPVVEYLRDHTAVSDRIVSMDPRQSYYLMDHTIHFGYPLEVADLRTYDYVVYGSWAPTVYAGLGADLGAIRAALDDPAQFEQVFAGPSSSIVIYRMLQPPP
ncbi:MAG: ArnT family glycosyltransferase, partial [Anaerolineales bacterium]